MPGVLRRDALICIRSDHPALPGHFPGMPIVPAVVVLDQLVQAAESQLGKPLALAGLPHAKFLAPLLPDQVAHCAFQIEGGRLQFRVDHEGKPIAQGAFALAAEGSG